jgi:para-nitrobenzyl esterase
MPALHLAEAAHAGGARVWLYELCWGFGAAGASHGLDTLLVFGTAHIDTGLTAAGPEAMARASRLSGLIRSEHLAFAATGDLGWVRYEPHGRAARVHDSESTVVAYPEQRSREIWRDRRFGVLDLPTT